MSSYPAGRGSSFPYAGQLMHVLAGDNSQPDGFAAMEVTIPARFAGPIPHAHEGFDEAIYVLGGRLQVTGDQVLEAGPGSMFTAPRGSRYGFSNPFAEDALVRASGRPPGPHWPSCARSGQPCRRAHGRTPR
jgi:quercetin dioxygenase-like cupin family protein